MCLVWCHGNPTGKWDRTHLVVPTRPVTIRDGLASAVSASGSSFESVDPVPATDRWPRGGASS